MLEVAGQASQKHYHSISGEILPHFDVNNIIAQKLTKLQHLKENPSRKHYEISQNEKNEL